jgi:predicted RNA-binding Zn-ribbon protein involved in translation (DUF1610 family)
MKFERNKDFRLCVECGKEVEVGDHCYEHPESRTNVAFDCPHCNAIGTATYIREHFARHYIGYTGPMSRELQKLVESVS